MAKRCIICEDEATYKIKNTFDYYCNECATDNFSDLNFLIHVEEEAIKLKKLLAQRGVE